MDSARDKRSGRIIDAIRLWEMEVVGRDHYVCPGCGIQVFPASFQKGVSKRAPYFTPSANKHIDPCGVSGFEKLVDRAKEESISLPDGFPLPYPNKLVLTDERPVVDGGDTRPVPHGAATRPGGRPNGQVAASFHGHTVATIRPICGQYMQYPHDRGLDLSIPDCPGDTYATVFQRLAFSGIWLMRQRTRLFCVALRWSAPARTDEHMEVSLDAGEWDEATGKPGRFYRLRVQWAHWTDRQRTTLHGEIRAAQQDAIDSRRQDQKSPGKAWVFFVGTQDAEDDSLIVASRYALVCCRFGDMLSA